MPRMVKSSAMSLQPKRLPRVSNGCVCTGTRERTHLYQTASRTKMIMWILISRVCPEVLKKAVLQKRAKKRNVAKTRTTQTTLATIRARVLRLIGQWCKFHHFEKATRALCDAVSTSCQKTYVRKCCLTCDKARFSAQQWFVARLDVLLQSRDFFWSWMRGRSVAVLRAEVEQLPSRRTRCFRLWSVSCNRNVFVLRRSCV
mmetsp:Transcript_93554/g.147815  ORF Transcript_93554/g.147815 Transcript_93554/m.147815 type:complete len:201 (-) Transcript_93554:71-673(-)